MLQRKFVIAGVIAVSSLGCSAEGPGAPLETLGSDSAEIYFGTADTTHQAVVALFSGFGACTATIVEVIGTQGYALTAAHCIENDPPTLLVQGDDYAKPGVVTYPPVEYALHPNYDGEFYDFAMIRFTGAGPSTPKIPVLTAQQDNLSPGDVVDLVGYGKTEQDDENSTRRHIARPIANATSLTLSYNQATGGLCFGDSGGPALATVGGAPRVAGVSHAVLGYCQNVGISARASAVQSTFIQPFIDDGPIGAQTCEQCVEASTQGVGGCVGAVKTCFDHPDCEELLECFDECQNDACFDACVDAHPLGFQYYLDIYECTCTTTCTNECANDQTYCPKPPACGFNFGANACGACIQSKCCALGTTCADDNLCSACAVSADPPPGCAESEPFKALVGCFETTCSAECGGSSPNGSGGDGAGGSMGASTGGVGLGPSGDGGSGGAGVGGAAAGGADADDSDRKTKTKTKRSASDDGCSTTPGDSTGSAFPALTLLALALVSRRRRR